MAFFDEAQLAAIRIERMVFHLVGPQKEDFVRLEAVDPAGFVEFFLERIRSVNLGSPYVFSDASATRERLSRMTKDAATFQGESEKLAEDFQRLHGGSASAGALLIFTLKLGEERCFALLKYDDETVVAYAVEDGNDGRKKVSLEALERTFVQNKAALQKSALIRLTDEGGDLVVLDRRNQQKVARYFEAFLDAIRLHQDDDLTAKLVKVTREVIKRNRDLVPPEVHREIYQRTYDAAVAGGTVDGDAQLSFLETVIGRKLVKGDPLIAKFQGALRSARIEGVPVALTAGAVSKPKNVQYKTVKGITIRAPKELERLIETVGKTIVIKDALDEKTDDAD